LIGDPNIYLGSKLQIVTFAMVFRLRVQVLVYNVQEVVRCKQRKGIKLPKRITALWPIDYASKLDESPELYLASYYQALIGIFH